jgi:hypothetical protein
VLITVDNGIASYCSGYGVHVLSAGVWLLSPTTTCPPAAMHGQIESSPEADAVRTPTSRIAPCQQVHRWCGVIL